MDSIRKVWKDIKRRLTRAPAPPVSEGPDLLDLGTGDVEYVNVPSSRPPPVPPRHLKPKLFPPVTISPVPTTSTTTSIPPTSIPLKPTNPFFSDLPPNSNKVFDDFWKQ